MLGFMRTPRFEAPWAPIVRRTTAIALVALATLGAGSAAAGDSGADSTASPTATMKAAEAAPAPRYPVVVDTPPDSILIGLLRRGDYVLLLRHASTDWGQRDADVVNFADRNAQRNLSAIGRAQADSIGAAVRALGLKVGRVLASPMWRCRDTAELAFGHADTTIDLFIKGKQSRDVRVKWLSTPITNDSLFVLVSHQDPYLPLFRFQRDQLKEADALLIEPLGNDQWKLVAQLSPADWTRLAARYGR
jgi:phosphohistidine phosphatase SixA